MTEVFELLFYGLEEVYHIFKAFSFSVYGFSFSLWDFLITLFLLSLIVPLVVSSDHSVGFSNLSRWFTRNSERNKSKKEDDS